MVSIRFGALQPASIPVEEMDPLDTEVRVIPDDSEEIERGLVAVTRWRYNVGRPRSP